MSREPQPLARLPVLLAVLVLAAVLVATSNGYGYHRDELYFRALPPDWGYVDQPPFTPWLTRTMASISDQLWVERLPAALFACAAVVVVALIAAEVGGGAGAQSLAAWGAGFGVFPMVFGHIVLTASVDLVIWPLLGLFVIRAVRRDPRWLVAAGAAIGLATFNRLLIVLLAMALVAGVLIAGPRRLLMTRWLLIGVGVAAVLATPAIAYQVLNDWPQLAMGEALGQRNGAEVRAQLIPFLALLLGPPLTIVWLVGLIWPWRSTAGRELRFLAPALGVFVLLCLASPGQVYYPLGLLTIIYAVGCVPVARWARTRLRAGAIGVLVGINAVIAAVSALPLIPESQLASTPIPGMSQAVADQIGWEEYVSQIAVAYARLDPATSAIVTSNYGEHGAIARFGPDHALPRAYSGTTTWAPCPLHLSP